GEGRRIARSRGERRLRRAVGIETLDRRLRLGLDPEVARRADADEQTAVARIDGNVPVGMPLHDAEHALLCDHLFADHPRRWPALLEGYFRGLLLRRPAARTQRAEAVRHFPDAVLVGDQHVIVTPGQSVRPFESFGMAVDPICLAVAVLVAQQRQITDPLL